MKEDKGAEQRESSPGERDSQAPEEGLGTRPETPPSPFSSPLSPKSPRSQPSPPVYLSVPSRRTPSGTPGGNANNLEKRLSLLSNSPTPRTKITIRVCLFLMKDVVRTLSKQVTLFNFKF